MNEDEIASMLKCLQAKAETYQKGQYVLRQGEFIDRIMVLVKGSLHIQNEDYWGNRSIMNMISMGEMFGEAYVAPESDELLNDVVAAEESVVLFFDVNRTIITCPMACTFHKLVVQNLFLAISEKNRKLVQKLVHMSQRTTREKLMSYLSDEAKKQKSNTFAIPFNRQELADFLSVDRSGMSNELCKMRDAGLLAFEKNRFTLL